MLQEDVLDALRRQLDELEALRCMYPDAHPPVLQLDDHQRQALALAAHCCGGGNSGAGDWAMLTGSDDSCGLAHAAAADGRGCRSDAGRGGVDQGVDGGVLEAMAQEALREGTLPLLSGTIRPPDLSYGGEPVALRFTLPRAYPADPQQPPLLAVECAGPRWAHDELSCALQRLAGQEAGGECLLLAVDCLRDSVEQLAARGPEAPGHDRSAPPGDGAADAADAGAGAGAGGGAGPCGREPREDGVLCVLVWLHHLKSTTKRKLICQWARELKLSGACKPGFPGVVVVEGPAEDAREFVARMRSLSWQAMQVRCEDLAPLRSPGARQQQQQQQQRDSGKGGCSGSGVTHDVYSGLRRLQGPFVELEESGMSELSATCREAGLHHVFMTALKL